MKGGVPIQSKRRVCGPPLEAQPFWARMYAASSCDVADPGTSSAPMLRGTRLRKFPRVCNNAVSAPLVEQSTQSRRYDNWRMVLDVKPNWAFFTAIRPSFHIRALREGGPQSSTTASIAGSSDRLSGIQPLPGDSSRGGRHVVGWPTAAKAACIGVNRPLSVVCSTLILEAGAIACPSATDRPGPRPPLPLRANGRPGSLTRTVRSRTVAM